MGRRAATAAGLVALLLLVGAADGFLDGLAHDNLSNAGFDRIHERTPWQLGLPAENVTIPSDGLALAGWWMPAPAGSANASTTVVLVHGVSSQMGRMVRMWAPMLHEAGYSLLAFDLRNHGASPDAHGGLVTYGTDESRDVLAAMAWVQDRAGDLGVDPDRVVLYGGSMGAASVLDAAGTNPPGLAAAVADSSYASFTFQAHLDGQRKGYPGWLVDLVVAKMDDAAPSPPTHSRPDAGLAATRAPVLLLACSNDQRVTQPNLDLLAAARPGVREWEAACGPGISPDHHLDGWMQPGYNATVLAFLDGV